VWPLNDLIWDKIKDRKVGAHDWVNGSCWQAEQKRQKESQSFDHVAIARKEEGQISQDEEERQ